MYIQCEYDKFHGQFESRGIFCFNKYRSKYFRVCGGCVNSATVGESWVSVCCALICCLICCSTCTINVYIHVYTCIMYVLYDTHCNSTPHYISSLFPSCSCILMRREVKHKKYNTHDEYTCTCTCTYSTLYIYLYKIELSLITSFIPIITGV